MKYEDHWDDAADPAHDGAHHAAYDDVEYEDAPGDDAVPAGSERVEEGRSGGLPLKGLAMILIAVAVLLALWGVYSLLRGGDDEKDDDAAGTSPTAITGPATPAPPGQADPNAPAPAPGADPGADPNAPAPAPGADPNAPAPAPAPGADPGADPNAPAPAPAPPAGPPATEVARVNVLNNSTRPDWARSTADELGAEGQEVGEVGNLPGGQARLPQTTVYYDPANPAAEARARELADRHGGVARPFDDSLPAERHRSDEVTIVLVG